MKRRSLRITASALVLVLFVISVLSARAQGTSGWTIAIDVAKKLGPSQVKKFLFVQGGPLFASDADGSNEASRQFETAAWKALDLGSESVYLIDDGGQWGALLSVVRTSAPPPNAVGPLGPNRDLYLDISRFDAVRQDALEKFAGSEKSLRLLFTGFTPKTLSTNPSADDYMTYPPKDYAEWRAVLEAAVRYLNQRGIRGPLLGLFGEPESDTVFNVLDPNGKPFPLSTEPVLREYAQLYAESQRAVKAADRDAIVLAMCASVSDADYFRELRGDPAHKGLDDFISYVAEYNAALPPGVPPATLDNICWQGYSWQGEKRLMPMAEGVQSALARYEFDPATPQYVDGWSGGWAGPLGNRYPLPRYASHLVYNVLDQLNPGGRPGPIAQAHYYTWNLEEEQQKGSSLVRTKHDAISWGPVASDRNCLRPAYIAFQGLKVLEDAAVLETSETRPELARSIAVTGGDGIRVLLVNYTNTPQTARLSLNNLPSTALFEQAALRRVPEREACGDGNWFPSGNLATLFTNEPAGLTKDASGIVVAAVSLPVNGVALLDIPLQASAASGERPATDSESQPTSVPEPTPGISDKQPTAQAGSKTAFIALLAVLVGIIVAAGIGGVWLLRKRRRDKRNLPPSIAPPRE